MKKWEFTVLWDMKLFLKEKFDASGYRAAAIYKTVVFLFVEKARCYWSRISVSDKLYCD